MMSYKFLNTIIDDLFAFIIKMPTMHRLACFRDGEGKAKVELTRVPVRSSFAGSTSLLSWR
jgi:hypothetical protein